MKTVYRCPGCTFFWRDWITDAVVRTISFTIRIHRDGREELMLAMGVGQFLPTLDQHSPCLDFSLPDSRHCLFFAAPENSDTQVVDLVVLSEFGLVSDGRRK
jgi:hypothetical protein